jgi:hypothetical protein
LGQNFLIVDAAVSKKEWNPWRFQVLREVIGIRWKRRVSA